MDIHSALQKRHWVAELRWNNVFILCRTIKLSTVLGSEVFEMKIKFQKHDTVLVALIPIKFVFDLHSWYHRQQSV